MNVIKQYRKKPVVIDAIIWDGSMQSTKRVLNFVGQKVVINCSAASDAFSEYHTKCLREGLMIKTLEGQHIASIGDYIIKGVKGEFYPCKPDIFNKTYEEV